MINDYGKFVNTTTSNESKFTGDFINRLMVLQQHHKDVQWSRLMTSAIGMLAESGEFTEIMKKIFFQGKEMTEENRFHMKRELGDVFWYWTQACRSLGLDPNDVIQENVNKLESRYPGGSFDAHYSENRKDGDL